MANKGTRPEVVVFRRLMCFQVVCGADWDGDVDGPVSIRGLRSYRFPGTIMELSQNSWVFRVSA